MLRNVPHPRNAKETRHEAMKQLLFYPHNKDSAYILSPVETSLVDAKTTHTNYTCHHFAAMQISDVWSQLGTTGDESALGFCLKTPILSENQ